MDIFVHILSSRIHIMEKLIEVFMENPEAGFALLKGMIEKYKPMAYEAAGVVMDIYKDFANNKEYPATVAKVKKNMYDAYLAAGFNEDQALALMINDNIQLMNNIKKQSSKVTSTKKGN